MGLTREAIEKIVVEHVEAENARDMARVMRTYAEVAVFEDVPREVCFEGKEAIAASYQERFKAFPDMVRTIDRMTTGDQGAVTEITMSGVQKGVYAGLPPRPGVQSLRIAALQCEPRRSHHAGDGLLRCAYRCGRPWRSPRPELSRRPHLAGLHSPRPSPSHDPGSTKIVGSDPSTSASSVRAPALSLAQPPGHLFDAHRPAQVVALHEAAAMS